jgi:hypothetical protein
MLEEKHVLFLDSNGGHHLFGEEIARPQSLLMSPDEVIPSSRTDLAVLQGAQSALSDKKIGLIQFEYGGTWHDAGISIISATELLDNLGYRIYEFLADIESFREIEFKSDDYQYQNLYACRKGQMPFALA